MPLGGSTIGLVVSLGLAGASFLLMAAVWFAAEAAVLSRSDGSHRLSYLAVLTSLGAVSALRVLAVGSAALR